MTQNRPNTIGQIHKNQSDMIMEQTWDRDIQSKKCYIYDYYHDGEKDKNKNLSPSTDVLKTAIDAKFIVVQYGSEKRIQFGYHVQFKPSHVCELDYFEDEYEKKYWSEYPIGLYIDIPDEQGIYKKWMIVSKEEGNQFTKYFVLPCNFNFHWIIDNKKYSMWGISRPQNSYNSGVWQDNVTTSVENQNQFWLPMNPIAEELYYDQRIIVSTPVKKPIVWKITKVENVHPTGINKFTLLQSKFDPNTDKLVDGVWYADYNKYAMEPTSGTIEVNPVQDYSKIQASSNIIKSGGSYKILKATFYNADNEEINTYSPIWDFEIDDADASSFISTSVEDINGLQEIKIKLEKNDTLLGKVLKVTVMGANGECMSSIDLEVKSL